MKRTVLSTADSYKFGHPFLTPDNQTNQYNFMEARHSKSSHVIFCTMEYYIKEFLLKVPNKKQIKRLARIAPLHGVPFDKKMWKYIKKLGYYPIEIKAIPEGTRVPVGVPLATFKATDEKCKGLVGFIETLFMNVWMGTAVATQSYEVKQMLLKYGSVAWVEFAYHNFGNRSATCPEHAQIAGFTHLTQFKGTDSISSLLFAEDYYDQPEDKVAGFSVLATEHSITSMHGRDGEEEFVWSVMNKFPKNNILSFVGDTYNIYEFTKMITNPNGRIRKLLDSRPWQKIVIRPDSGEPIEVLSNVITIMKDNNCFDSEIDGKLLSTKYGLLWGDGVNMESIEKILNYFTTYTSIAPSEQTQVTVLAAENFVFGSGTDLINSKNRDTHGFAIKCSEITFSDDYTLEVFKDPITDKGKKSRKGKVTTFYNTVTKEYRVGILDEPKENEVDALVLVFRDGELFNESTLDDIRNRAI